MAIIRYGGMQTVPTYHFNAIPLIPLWPVPPHTYHFISIQFVSKIHLQSFEQFQQATHSTYEPEQKALLMLAASIPFPAG